jgi:CubicO group peptidase (beta-lactamase class C family)
MNAKHSDERVSRRGFLQGAVASAAAISLSSPLVARAAASPATRRVGHERPARVLFGELDARIEAGMKQYAIPGAAVGVLYQGREYVKGYGVTNVDYPVAVDGDTVFRAGSTTKTFTGTAVMRLVEQGKLDLDARVRRYLPGFRTSEPGVAARVTLRQLLNHSPGWLGDYFQDFGAGDDALARYVEGMVRVPQLTPLGSTFFYNNPAISLAGRVIEVVTGSSYEAAVRSLLLDPLGLAHSRFFSDQIVGFNVAASHNVVDGKAVVDPSFWHLPRSLNPTGGLISSARDQLRWARFHLGDGRAPSGKRLLSRASLARMRSRPGPGGTLLVELEGMGVTWMLRPSAQGVRIVQHGGDWAGQHSGFMMVPERGFAMTLLTNSESGPKLIRELFYDDWALRRFAAVSNLPARLRVLSRRELAAYEGRYVGQAIEANGKLTTTTFEIRGDNGQLRVLQGSDTFVRLGFYRKDYVLVLDPAGQPIGARADFLRGADGRIAWWRFGGRLIRHQQN